MVLKGQGRGQGVVYMDKNGELTFSKGDEKQGGLFDHHIDITYAPWQHHRMSLSEIIFLC